MLPAPPYRHIITAHSARTKKFGKTTVTTTRSLKPNLSGSENATRQTDGEMVRKRINPNKSGEKYKKRKRAVMDEGDM